MALSRLMRSSVKTLSIDPPLHSIEYYNSNRVIMAIEIIANIHAGTTYLRVKQHTSWTSRGPEYEIDSGSNPYCIAKEQW